MVEPITWHPAADDVTTEAVIIEQDRGFIPLSTWLLDAITSSDKVVQIVTPTGSRLTYPLELLLYDTHTEWIVCENQGGFRDGLAGFAVQWNGQRFVPDLENLSTDVEEPIPGVGDLQLHFTTVQRTSDTTRLGAGAETAIQAITGTKPLGWGVAEPASQPWSPRELTAYCRERAPRTTFLVIVGDGVVGRIVVERVDTGVLERVQLSGPQAGSVAQETVDGLAAELADGGVRSLIVAAHPGRLGGYRSSVPTFPALPSGILIGHSALAGCGRNHAEKCPIPVRMVGRGRQPAAWYRLDDTHTPPYEALAMILEYFDLSATAVQRHDLRSYPADPPDAQ